MKRTQLDVVNVERTMNCERSERAIIKMIQLCMLVLQTGEVGCKSLNVSCAQKWLVSHIVSDIIFGDLRWTTRNLNQNEHFKVEQKELYCLDYETACSTWTPSAENWEYRIKDSCCRCEQLMACVHECPEVQDGVVYRRASYFRSLQITLSFL
jgi:hypothetical protein